MTQTNNVLSSSTKRMYVAMLVILVALLIWSAIRPISWSIWIYETSVAIIGIALLWWLYRYHRWVLTPLSCTFIFIGAVIALIAGHYTYAHVPLVDPFMKIFGWSRNPFDRFGHTVQGVILTVLSREVFLRKRWVQKKYASLMALVSALCISAAYELFEFFTGWISGTSLQVFLGYQGDIWDSHWDMVSALIGGILFLLFFRKMHDKQIMQRIGRES